MCTCARSSVCARRRLYRATHGSSLALFRLLESSSLSSPTLSLPLSLPPSHPSSLPPFFPLSLSLFLSLSLSLCLSLFLSFVFFLRTSWTSRDRGGLPLDVASIVPPPRARVYSTPFTVRRDVWARPFVPCACVRIRERVSCVCRVRVRVRACVCVCV